MISRTALLGYALSFASFVVDSKIGNDINKIILFGSVARGDFSEESDVDIFIDCDDKFEKDLLKMLSLFRESQMHKIWRLKGVAQDISLKVGRLHEWKLRREVISSGILLYGKYNELPSGAEYYALVRIDGISERRSAEQMKLFRALYGYKQRIGKKIYESKGLVVAAGGLKLGKGVSLVPMERRQELISFLNKNKVRYKIHELWSDGF